MNIEQAKERLKGIVDFYKLNDPDNYDYSDDVLISMKLVLEEIERLNNIIKEVREYIMSELITEYDIKNGGNVTGSDLPVEAITPILEILEKKKKK